MALRPQDYQIPEILDRKRDSRKYDADFAQETLDWLSKVSVEPISVEGKGKSANSVMELLKDGTVLLKVMNVIRKKNGQSGFRINYSTMAFKQIENIWTFLNACDKLGVPKVDLFETPDLYEGQNILNVLMTIRALAKKVQELGLDLPIMGPAVQSQSDI